MCNFFRTAQIDFPKSEKMALLYEFEMLKWTDQCFSVYFTESFMNIL